MRSYRNYYIPESSMYTILEDLYPFMSDEDMYFVDKVLHIVRRDGINAGTLNVDPLRFYRTDAAKYKKYKHLGYPSYAMCRAAQFSPSNNPFNDKSLLVTAIKFVNPNYSEFAQEGKNPVTVEYDVACCVNDGEPLPFSGKFSVTMAANEFSKVVYVPLEDMNNIPELGYGVKDFKVMLFEEGVERPIKWEKFKYINTPIETVPAFNLVDSPYEIQGKQSSISTRVFMHGKLALCLCAVKFKDNLRPDKLEMAIKVEKQNTLEQSVANISYIELNKMPDVDAYLYEDAIFGDLSLLVGSCFSDGKYKIGFYQMDEEVFYVDAVVHEEDLKILNPDNPFRRAENLGQRCNLDDFIAGRAEQVLEELQQRENSLKALRLESRFRLNSLCL